MPLNRFEEAARQEPPAPMIVRPITEEERARYGMTAPATEPVTHGASRPPEEAPSVSIASVLTDTPTPTATLGTCERCGKSLPTARSLQAHRARCGKRWDRGAAPRSRPSPEAAAESFPAADATLAGWVAWYRDRWRAWAVEQVTDATRCDRMAQAWEVLTRVLDTERSR